MTSEELEDEAVTLLRSALKGKRHNDRLYLLIPYTAHSAPTDCTHCPVRNRPECFARERSGWGCMGGLWKAADE